MCLQTDERKKPHAFTKNAFTTIELVVFKTILKIFKHENRHVGNKNIF